MIYIYLFIYLYMYMYVYIISIMYDRKSLESMVFKASARKASQEMAFE